MEDTKDDELIQLQSELKDLRRKYDKLIQDEHNLQSSQAIFYLD